MRLITVRTPQGMAKKVAEIAFSQGIENVTVSSANVLSADHSSRPGDIIDIETNTPRGKAFVENLSTASFYDPRTFSFTSRHPESIFASEPPEQETYPIVRSTHDIYNELWQFCRITSSLVMRVLLSAILVAYGMKEDYMPLIIAGLLFLPYHHHLLGMALAGSIKEGRFFKRAVLAFLLSTALILLGGVIIGLLTHAPVKFTAFKETPVAFSFLISLVIGIAAGFGSIDDAGRRELIGLAATAHLSIYPIWFGLKFAFGFDASDKPWELLLVFLMDIVTITFAAYAVYLIMKTRGEGIKNFLAVHKKKT